MVWTLWWAVCGRALLCNNNTFFENIPHCFLWIAGFSLFWFELLIVVPFSVKSYNRPLVFQEMVSITLSTDDTVFIFSSLQIPGVSTHYSGILVLTHSDKPTFHHRWHHTQPLWKPSSSWMSRWAEPWLMLKKKLPHRWLLGYLLEPLLNLLNLIMCG